MDKQMELKAKIRSAKEELKTAGEIHRRDLFRYIHRLQKELLIYNRQQAANGKNAFID